MSTELGQFSGTVLDKARKLLKFGYFEQDPEQPNVWWVRSSNGTYTYGVRSNFDPETRELSWLTCTCPHGRNKGAGQTRCYHAAAVLITLQEEGTAHEPG